MSTRVLLWRQFRFERRLFWRNPSAAFFNFMLPLIFLFLIASVFGHRTKDLNTLVPGISGMAVMTTTFTALAFNITFLREQGILKRMRGTPMPPVAYFGGLLLNAVTNAVTKQRTQQFVQRLARLVLWHLPQQPYPSEHPRSLHRTPRELRG